MVGSVEVFSGDLNLEKVEPLPEDFDPTEVIKDPLPPVVIDCCEVIDNGRSEEKKLEREIVLGRNVHTMCFDVTEPDADDEVTGEREGYMASVLARYRKSLIERTKHHLGYPYNLDFDYGALGQLQHFSINNLGDPFIESNYGVHSRQFEVGVLDWFARLWELEKNEYWGYITNCGTEGNLHGILVGREVFPDGILYGSRESHYSVFKAARMYRMECEKILAGNCRKVSAVRFERVNYDDATLEVKEVTRLFPKIMKRKWSSNEDSDKTDDYDEVPHEKRADDDDLSDDYIINEHENDHDEHPGKQ